MSALVVPVGIAVLALFAVEIARWKLRPEARRLRMIRKIGGPR
jgi:hypothetical protein